MEATKKINKLNFSLEGRDGNAFALLGAFQKQARLERWSKDEISAVIVEATNGDYDHLVRTLLDYCE